MVFNSLGRKIAGLPAAVLVPTLGQERGTEDAMLMLCHAVDKRYGVLDLLPVLL
jgi:hypothetical protein